MIYQLTTAEEEAVREIATASELSTDQVMRLAIRHYQLVRLRVAKGEICTWSGDAQRAREFFDPTIIGADACKT